MKRSSGVMKEENSAFFDNFLNVDCNKMLYTSSKPSTQGSKLMIKYFTSYKSLYFKFLRIYY